MVLTELSGHLLLASNINLLTHYAKGTLSIFFKFFLELLIKLLFFSFPSRYYLLSLNIPYLALEEGSPLLIQTGFNPFYLLFFFLIFYKFNVPILWFWFT